MDRIRQWWRRPDQYHRLSAYLESRGLQRPTRYVIGSVMAVFGLVPPAMMLSPAGPKTAPAIVVSVCIGVACAASSLLWFTRWPTQHQSAAFAVVATASIVAGGLCATDV